MAILTPGTPLTVNEPQLLVENQLPAGRYRFRLVAIDEGDLESDPAELIVSVHDVPRPQPGPRGPMTRAEMLERFRVRPDVMRRVIR